MKLTEARQIIGDYAKILDNRQGTVPIFLEESRLPCSKTKIKNALKVNLAHSLTNPAVDWGHVSDCMHAYSHLAHFIDDKEAQFNQTKLDSIVKSIELEGKSDIGIPEICPIMEEANRLTYEIAEYISQFESGAGFLKELKETEKTQNTTID